MRRTMMILMAGCSLAGCATTSFAPPAVNLENEMSSVGSNRSIGQRCMPNERQRNNASIAITEDVNGARRLIDNFILSYRCRAHSAANGRQAFEVPGFLSLAGAAAASAFGGGSDWGIAGGVANSVLASGNKYYAAQRKAEIYDHALDALLCIKTEAVDIDAFTAKAIDDAQGGGEENEFLLNAIGTGDGDGPEVTVGASEQYFDMVKAALLSVERIAAQRLSNAGTPFDATGVIAEIEALNKKKEEETKKGEPEAEEAARALVNQPSLPRQEANESQGAFAMRMEDYNDTIAARSALRSMSFARVSETILKLRLLQPELQGCVVRAKV